MYKSNEHIYESIPGECQDSIYANERIYANETLSDIPEHEERVDSDFSSFEDSDTGCEKDDGQSSQSSDSQMLPARKQQAASFHNTQRITRKFFKIIKRSLLSLFVDVELPKRRCYCDILTVDMDSMTEEPALKSLKCSDFRPSQLIMPVPYLINHYARVGNKRRKIAHSFIIGNLLITPLTHMMEDKTFECIETTLLERPYYYRQSDYDVLYHDEFMAHKLHDLQPEPIPICAVDACDPVFIYTSSYLDGKPKEVMYKLEPKDGKYTIPERFKQYLSTWYGCPVIDINGDLVGVVRKDLTISIFAMQTPNEVLRLFNLFNTVK